MSQAIPQSTDHYSAIKHMPSDFTDTHRAAGTTAVRIEGPTIDIPDEVSRIFYD